jgi:phenylalanyl-tRNA synthetase beta chain
MQFSENWLREFVNPPHSSDELSHTLTMSGLEVEEMSAVAPMFNLVVIGEIVEATKHPDADRLQICKVNIGAEILQIVCGASNARIGLKVPCALVGAELPELSIKKAKVRGVESFGMLCSAKEIGLSAEADGLLELPNDAELGMDIRKYLDLSDQIFTLKLTPNRADCLSILGIARDVMAMTGAKVTQPIIKNSSVSSQLTLPVLISETHACPAYFGRVVEGVNANALTPSWMVRRLERSGIRSISAIVDITNYVLLELGQPMHAFDHAKIAHGLQVRFSNAGEKLLLLNEQDISLLEDDLVIADSSGPLALAGIMGGKNSAVNADTNSIFLESAFFEPDVMAGKARRKGLSTDSSYRFERGVDFGNTLNALERATDLILDICGGNAGGITQAITVLPNRAQVELRYTRLTSVLGIEIGLDNVGKLLSQLNFIHHLNGEIFTIQAPSYRFDITREEDLIEEIARLHGYDKIPAITPTASMTITADSESTISVDNIRQSMVTLGYQEVVTYSFVDEEWENTLMNNLMPIKLKNPIASNLSVMRSSMWGGLLDVLSYNLNRKQERAMLFEMGNTYHLENDHYVEKSCISGLFYGDVMPEQWSINSKEVDFFDIKATIDQLIHKKGSYLSDTHNALHPGQSAKIYIDNLPIGWIGKLHPKWQQKYDLPKSAFLFELTINAIQQVTMPNYIEISKQVAIRRDISLLVDQSVNAQAIIDAVNVAKIPLLQQIQLFDVYQGKGVPENKKSLAFLVLMQDTHKTLLDSEVDAAMLNLLNLMKMQFSAELR